MQCVSDGAAKEEIIKEEIEIKYVGTRIMVSVGWLGKACLLHCSRRVTFESRPNNQENNCQGKAPRQEQV